jgi:hypothetical protein
MGKAGKDPEEHKSQAILLVGLEPCGDDECFQKTVPRYFFSQVTSFQVIIRRLVTLIPLFVQP